MDYYVLIATINRNIRPSFMAFETLSLARERSLTLKAQHPSYYISITKIAVDLPESFK